MQLCLFVCLSDLIAFTGFLLFLHEFDHEMCFLSPSGLALRRTKYAHKSEPREAEAEICCTQIETETYIHNPLSDLCLEPDSRQIHVASNQENGSEHTQDVANTGHWILEQP